MPTHISLYPCKVLTPDHAFSCSLWALTSYYLNNWINLYSRQIFVIFTNSREPRLRSLGNSSHSSISKDFCNDFLEQFLLLPCLVDGVCFQIFQIPRHPVLFAPPPTLDSPRKSATSSSINYTVCTFHVIDDKKLRGNLASSVSRI